MIPPRVIGVSPNGASANTIVNGARIIRSIPKIKGLLIASEKLIRNQDNPRSRQEDMTSAALRYTVYIGILMYNINKK